MFAADAMIFDVGALVFDEQVMEGMEADRSGQHPGIVGLRNPEAAFASFNRIVLI